MIDLFRASNSLTVAYLPLSSISRHRRIARSPSIEHCRKSLFRIWRKRPAIGRKHQFSAAALPDQNRHPHWPSLLILGFDITLPPAPA
jgi:hypothetical protein